MSYYEGLTEKEISYIEEAKKIGAEQGNCKELSELCRRAYSEYKLRSISSTAYNKIYATCMDYAYPR